MAPVSPAADLYSLKSVDARSAGALGFMPRLLVLTTLPHRRPKSHHFERVNGRYSVRMSAPRRVGLPYGSYSRLLLAYLTTEAVRTKSPEIVLSENFFEEIAHSAVPIGLRALRSLKASPLAMDLHVWLTYRMSYLRKPTLIPWDSLQAQFGSTTPGRETSDAELWAVWKL